MLCTVIAYKSFTFHLKILKVFEAAPCLKLVCWPVSILFIYLQYYMCTLCRQCLNTNSCFKACLTSTKAAPNTIHARNNKAYRNTWL